MDSLISIYPAKSTSPTVVYRAYLSHAVIGMLRIARLKIEKNHTIQSGIIRTMRDIYDPNSKIKVSKEPDKILTVYCVFDSWMLLSHLTKYRVLRILLTSLGAPSSAVEEWTAAVTFIDHVSRWGRRHGGYYIVHPNARLMGCHASVLTLMRTHQFIMLNQFYRGSTGC